MSSYVIGNGENSSRFLPATALRPVVTIWRSSYAQNSPSLSRTMCGARSRQRSGTRSCHSRAGSMKWSSTDTNQLMLMCPPGERTLTTYYCTRPSRCQGRRSREQEQSRRESGRARRHGPKRDPEGTESELDRRGVGGREVVHA